VNAPRPLNSRRSGFPASGMHLLLWLFLLGCSPAALAQSRPYIGFVYPAGGQQGTTFRIRLGGQNLDDVSSVLITGPGVTASVAECYRRLNNEQMQLLNEQVKLLKEEAMSDSARKLRLSFESNNVMSETPAMTTIPDPNQSPGQTHVGVLSESKRQVNRTLIDRIEARTLEYVSNPACPSIATLVILEITLAPDAEPGEREIRLVTQRGVSNPMSFYVGQLPEHSKKPMISATRQVLGKEAQALRTRLPGDDKERVVVPCTVNGQIASGEVQHYRFMARQGQRLVITALGRQLVPFIADAVPGWFQPVLALYDAFGKEVAYGDDYRFNPDPTLFYEVPRDGEYEFTIRDSLYRGREDFVYRITVGELPFITSIFPLGTSVGSSAKPQVKGWNVEGAELTSLPENASPHSLAVNRKGLISNRVPFAFDTLPELLESEPNHTISTGQKVTLPVIINGRVGKPDDWDVFRFAGKSNDLVVAEVTARRLDSPLDSVLKLTDASGNVLAFNDDNEDLGAGLNTHQADSYLLARLPADGTYFVHLGDTARQGGEEYGYRLRISAPQPDFELRVVPSSLAFRSKSSGTLTVYAQRKDGFAGQIKLALKDPPAGFTAPAVTLASTQTVAKLTIRTTLTATEEPVNLTVIGTAKDADKDLVREAVPAEDKMQAFLWRHLAPAKDLKVLVFDPAYQPPPKHVPPPLPPSLLETNRPSLANVRSATNAILATNLAAAVTASTNSIGGTNSAAVPPKPKFTKQQVASRLRELKVLFQEGMLTEEFYEAKVAECADAE
jgi:hypothetical protein